MPVNPDIIFILLYFKKKVYRQSEQNIANVAMFCFFMFMLGFAGSSLPEFFITVFC